MHCFRRSLSLLFFLFFFWDVNAQTISVGSLSGPLCSDTLLSVSFVTTGSFGADNVFSVQIHSNYSGNQYQTIPVSQSGDMLMFRLPTSLVADDNRLYSVRVVSSSPVLESAWSNSFQLLAPATAKLIDATLAEANPYEPFTLQFEAKGSAPILVTLSDGTRLRLNTFNGISTAVFYPKQTGTYQLESVENTCGVLGGSGSVRLTVNPLGIRTISATPSTLCLEDTLYVSYSKSGGNFGPGNRFRIQLKAGFPGYQPVNPAVYTVDALEDNGILKAVIPAEVRLDPNSVNAFRVQVLSSDPIVTGDPVDNYIFLRPKARAEILTPSQTINYGENVYLSVKLQGRGPLSASLSDGTLFSEPEETVTGGWIRPRQTTTYRVEKFQSACTTTAVTPGSAVVVVNPGIAVDSLPGQTAFCEGQAVRLKFSTNVSLSAGTRFSVVLASSSNDWTSAPIPAQREGDNYLSFTIPQVGGQSSFNNRFYQVMIQTDAPALRSVYSVSQLEVRGKPTFARFHESAATTLESPDEVYLSIATDGGGPYKVVVNDGKHDFDASWAGWPTARVTVFKTTTYALRSIGNSCGTLQNPGTSATVIVKKPAPVQLFVQPTSGAVCSGDSLLVTFDTTGTFLPGNEFRVQVANSIYGFGSGWEDLPVPVIGTGPKSPIKIKVPPYSKIRVVSTNPVAISNEWALPYDYKLSASIGQSSYDNREKGGVPYRVILAGEAITLPIEASSPGASGAYQLVYTDGTRNYTYTGNSWNAFQTDLKPLQTTTYRLVSISNGCGSGTVNGEATFTVWPFRIKTPIPTLNVDFSEYAYKVCGGGSLSVPFVVEGNPALGTTYTLQFASRRDSVFRDLVTGNASPLVARIPTTQEAGDYWLRIVAKGTEVRTVLLTMLIRQPATAILRPPAVTTITVNDSYQPTVSFAGTPPWRAVLNDNTTAEFWTSPGTFSLRPNKGTVYSLRAVTNVCGYGSLSGEARVSVMPTLSLTRLTTNEVCAGGDIPIAYEAPGDFESDNKLDVELWTAKGGFLQKLATVATGSGQVTLRLPSGLAAGVYQIRLHSTKPALVAPNPISVRLRDAPTVALTGSATVNAGQEVYLSARRQNPGDELDIESITYQLSEGARGTVVLSGRSPEYIKVTPSQTTTYRLIGVSGACGVGSGTGSATITVNPLQARSVTTGNPERTFACTGQQLSVPFATTGTFSAGNQFQVQLLDSTGNVVKSVAGLQNVSPLRFTLTDELAPATGYRFRVVASDAGTSNGASALPFQIHQRATVAFVPGLPPQSGQPVVLTIRFGGQGPWNYMLGNERGETFYLDANTNPTQFVPASGATKYTLLRVNNAVCGDGVVLQPSTIRADFVTATEPILPVMLWPNPTQDMIQVHTPSATLGATLKLTDLTGRVLLEQKLSQPVTFLSLGAFPEKVFILTVEREGKRQIYRVLKQ